MQRWTEKVIIGDKWSYNRLEHLFDCTKCCFHVFSATTPFFYLTYFLSTCTICIIFILLEVSFESTCTHILSYYKHIRVGTFLGTSGALWGLFSFCCTSVSAKWLLRNFNRVSCQLHHPEVVRLIETLIVSLESHYRVRYTALNERYLHRTRLVIYRSVRVLINRLSGLPIWECVEGARWSIVKEKSN